MIENLIAEIKELASKTGTYNQTILESMEKLIEWQKQHTAMTGANIALSLAGSVLVIGDKVR